MSFDSLISFQDNLFNNFEKANGIAATSARFLTFNRIFIEGKDCEGNKIGDYSTKETLVGSSSFLTKAGAQKILGSKSKRKALKWVTLPNGKRVAKLSGGYAVIRDADGRQTSFVDLSYSGNMRSDWQSIQNLNGFEMGWLTELSSKKAAGNEGRFSKDIFCLSDEEIEKITEIHLNALFS